MSWFVYILECRNNSLYTGITNDLEKRLQVHRAGKGSKFIRAFKVRRLVYKEPCVNKSKALKREWQIKALTRLEKLELIRKK